MKQRKGKREKSKISLHQTYAAVVETGTRHLLEAFECVIYRSGTKFTYRTRVVHMQIIILCNNTLNKWIL
jgi:hypothetical protein